jgi:hypothetical protein
MELRQHEDLVTRTPGRCPTIRKEEMELEVHFAHAGNTPPNFDVYHVHPRCHAIWELMRRMPKQ